jgi:carbonic anhydrase
MIHQFRGARRLACCNIITWKDFPGVLSEHSPNQSGGSMGKLTFPTIILFAVFAAAQQPATPGAAHHQQSAQPAESPDKIWSQLMAGNERFVTGQMKPEAVVSDRKSLINEQHPKVMTLSCSDSRVPPDVIFDQPLGTLFAVRTAGNIAGPFGLASLEYAFDHLGTTVLVVLGHTKCGAVTAACSGDKMPTPNLQAMVDQIEPAVMKVKQSASGGALIEAAIKENVHESAMNVVAQSEVLRHAKEEGKLTIIEAEYQLDTGKVVRLDKNTQ